MNYQDIVERRAKEIIDLISLNPPHYKEQPDECIIAYLLSYYGLREFSRMVMEEGDICRFFVNHIKTEIERIGY